MYRILKKHRIIIIPFSNLLFFFCFTQIVLNKVAGEGCFVIYILKMYMCVYMCVHAYLHTCSYNYIYNAHMHLHMDAQ